MPKVANDYVELLDPKGYVNNREITNIDPRFLVAPSINTLIKNKEKVVSRKGYTLKGAAKTLNQPIVSSFDWKTSSKIWRNLRGYHDELEVWYNSAWRRLAHQWDSTRFEFATWWDATELIDRAVFVNGSASIFSWSGGITDILSVTANTLTKKYWYQSATVAFAESGLTITDTNATFLTYGFAAGDEIVISGSALNDGTYIIDDVTETVITLSDAESLTDEVLGASVTISVNGRGTWGEERFYADGGSNKKIVINDIEYTYTGGEDTGTLTGVTPDPSAQGVVAGDIAMQAVETASPATLAGFDADRIAMINNHILVGSTSSRSIFMSKSSDYKDYTYTSPVRKPTEGFEMLLDDAPTGFIIDEDQAYISAGEDDFYAVRFDLSADLAGESIVIKKLKTSTGQAAINQGVITHIKNNVAFLSFEPTIDTLGRIQNIDTEQSVPISDDIRDLLEVLDTTDAHGFYHQRNLYFAFPKENIVLIYDTRYGYWQPPQTLPIARFALIDGQLCGHSSNSNETYRLFYGLNDNGAIFDTVAAFGYENYGSRFTLKNFDELAAEVRVSRTTVLTDKTLFEEDGSGGEISFDIDAENEQTVFSKDSNVSLGQNPLGYAPNGSVITTISELVKVRKIHTTPALDFFERQRIFSSSSKDVQWEILAYGENAQSSGNEPDFIRD